MQLDIGRVFVNLILQVFRFDCHLFTTFEVNCFRSNIHIIDLIFTSQPNMIMNSEVHPSLHSNCHHQIVYVKFDLKVFYPPPYERTVAFLPGKF